MTYRYKGKLYDFDDDPCGDYRLLDALKEDGVVSEATFYNTDERSYETLEDLFEALAEEGTIEEES